VARSDRNDGVRNVSAQQPGRPVHVTRADVARAAGTSTAVVSYVLNDGPRPVSSETRQKVLDAVESTGYRPDAIARALASGASRTLGMIVPDISNTFFTDLTDAVEEAASDAGLLLMLGDSDESPTRERELAESFVGRRVDGLLLVSVSPELDGAWVSSAGVPVVVLDRTIHDTRLHAITVDNHAGAGRATEHLIEHGHSHIGLLGGPVEQPTARARLDGWSDALRAAGREPNPSFVRHAPFTRHGGYEASLSLLDATERPDALFVASEQQAVGLLRATAELGLRVPEDLALITFDGTEISEYCTPQLTTVAQPITAIAADAIALITNHEIPGRQITHCSELIIRHSCGCTPSALHEKG
jgi:LacI family transcriptional regulator